MNKRHFMVSRHGRKLGYFDLFKYAKLSTGYEVFLFLGTESSISSAIVAVKKGDDTVEFQTFLKRDNKCFGYYIQMLCCYA